MVETGLCSDDIKTWYKSIMVKINNFCKRPPKNDELKYKSIEIGVNVDILKNWLEIKHKMEMNKRGPKRKEVAKIKGKITKNKRPVPTKVIKKFTEEEQNGILNAFYLRNPIPSLELKQSISTLLSCSYDKIDEWFLHRKPMNMKNKENGQKIWYEIAKQEIESGFFTMERKDVENIVELEGSYFTKQEINILEDFFFHDPYPSKNMIIWICNQLERNYSKVYSKFVVMRKSKYLKKFTLTSSERVSDFKCRMNETPAGQTTFDRPRMASEVNQGASTSAQISQRNTQNPFTSNPTSYESQFYSGFQY